MPKTILLLGDSEVAPIRGLKDELEELYDVRISWEYRPGRGIIDGAPMVTHTLRNNKDIDIIFLFGLTCFIWRKQVVTLSGTKYDMITINPGTNFTIFPAFMDSIHKMASIVNPKVKIYLVIPSIKDICTYNANRLIESKAGHLIPELENIREFSRAYLTEQARKVYVDSEGFLSNRLWWANKNTLAAHVVFNHYYYEAQPDLTYQEFPHHLFLDGRVDKLTASELCYDGLHYTPEFFRVMFEYLSPLRITRRTTVPTPTTMRVSPPPSPPPQEAEDNMSMVSPTSSPGGAAALPIPPPTRKSTIHQAGTSEVPLSIPIPNPGTSIKSRIFTNKSYRKDPQASTSFVSPTASSSTTFPQDNVGQSTSLSVSGSSVPIQTRIQGKTPSSTGAIPKRNLPPTSSTSEGPKRKRKAHPANIKRRERRDKKLAAAAAQVSSQSAATAGTSTGDSAASTSSEALLKYEKRITPILMTFPGIAQDCGVDKKLAITKAQELLAKMLQFNW